MEVNSSNLQSANAQKAKKRPSKEEIKARVQAKFGIEVGKPKKKEPDTVVTIDTKGEKKVSKEGFGRATIPMQKLHKRNSEQFCAQELLLLMIKNARP